MERNTNLPVKGYIVSNPQEYDKYHRYPWEKMYDKIKYGQHVNDRNNFLRVKTAEGDVITVRFYGIVDGGIERIDNRMKIEAVGCYYSENDYIARSIFIDGEELRIRNEPADYLYLLGPGIALLLGIIFILLFRSISNGASQIVSESNGDYVQNMKMFVKDFAGVWLICSTLIFAILHRIAPRIRIFYEICFSLIIGIIVSVWFCFYM